MTWLEVFGWVATGLNVWGNLSLTNKNASGWVIRLIANAAWIIYSIAIGGWALLANHIIFAVINIFGYYKWTKENNALSKSFGKWPGDETDEELWKASDKV